MLLRISDLDTWQDSYGEGFFQPMASGVGLGTVIITPVRGGQGCGPGLGAASSILKGKFCAVCWVGLRPQ